MADLNKELAKIHLEQKGFLTSVDVQIEEDGFESPGFDLLGVEINNGQVTKAVIGLVRGWWHAGSYLTPGVIRAHLETERKFLSDYFSFKRVQYIRDKFGFGAAPVYCVLFFSQRSPKKAEESERILNSMGVDVVYLEDIIIDVLPKIGNVALGDGVASQLLPMIRFSRLFRELRKAVKIAKRHEDDSKKKKNVLEKPDRRKKPIKEKDQLDFLNAFLRAKEYDDSEE